MERVIHAMRREKWKEIIQECNKNGMKKRDWLKEHNISEKAFYSWQRKIRMEMGTDLILARQNAVAHQPRFAVLEPPAAETVPPASTAVIRKTDIYIEIYEDISDAFLIRIIIQAVLHA